MSGKNCRNQTGDLKNKRKNILQEPKDIMPRLPIKDLCQKIDGSKVFFEGLNAK